ncbi:MAG TPA: TRAP transporter small permease [Rectinemataceae bacterium]|nr:TRAP transporter small permease [Rectinemataceae bacterium]
MKRILRVASDVFENVSVAFLAILCLSVFTQIILRNVFSIGSVVLEELARVSLVTLVFLMIPVLTLRKQQIIVDFVLNKLPAPVRKGFDLAIQLICLACSVYLLIAICNIMKMNYNVRTAALKMPNYIFYLPMTLGLTLDVIGSLDHFIDTVKGKEAAK